MDSNEYALIAIRRNMYHYIEEKNEEKQQGMVEKILSNLNVIVENSAYSVLNRLTPHEYTTFMNILRKFDKTLWEILAHRKECKHNWLISV